MEAQSKKGKQKRQGIAMQIQNQIGKVVLTVFVVVAIAAMGMIYAITNSANQTELTLESKSVAYQIEEFFGVYGAYAQGLATNHDIIDVFKNTTVGGDITKAEEYPTIMENLDNVQAIDDNIMQTWCADIDSSKLIDNTGYITEDGWDVTTRGWYSCVTDNKMIFTAPYSDQSTGKTVVTIAVPVYDEDGKAIGVVGIDMFIDQILQMMDQNKIGKNGSVMLFAEDGTYVYHKDASKVNENIQNQNVSENAVDAVVNQKEIFLKYNADGRYLGYCMPVGDTGYLVLSNLPVAEYYQTIFLSIVVLLVLFIIGAVLVVLGMRATAKKITTPIQELNVTARKLAEGNLDVALDIHSEDEIGELGHSISQTVDRLKEYIVYINEITYVLDNYAEGKLKIDLQQDYVGEFQKVKIALLNVSSSMTEVIQGINESAQQVTSGSEDLAKASQGLAEGASSQATAVEELVATAVNVAELVAENQKESAQAAQQTKQVSKFIEESQNHMNDMVVAMEKIKEVSNQMVGIIASIEEIADQTNLLALNASIEAARAGEVGRGFAVVAGEIGNLASQCADAVNNTRNLINISIDEIVRGNELAQGVSESLKASVEAVDDVNVVIQKTAESAITQEQAINEIRVGIEEISSGIRDNSAMAEESSATSEELAAQAVTLNEMVQKFEL